ncbi:hypothetical protein [uncultured Olleya sp.]|uniref:hypothetical protein n=1 Tax=uncultured Olleya sp. TaxID=757243 RepID=UPI00259AB3A0|nr:hypothetical protein [uncultured Olleya sp.]
MRKVLFILLVSLMCSCEDNSEPVILNETNNVVLLKVDYLTNIFEGGLEFEFSTSQNFTISSTYNPPGDFGDIQLYYSELNEKIFDGTIFWGGSGETSYPEQINLPESFTTINEDLELPDSSMFETVMYDQFAFYPETINYSSIWNSIRNLEIVKNYRNSNPQGKINLFLYTPSVGIGDPAEWDWYIYIKN